MIYKTKVLLLVTCLLFSCNRSKEQAATKPLLANTYFSSTHLIEAEGLMTISKNENIKIIDFRKEEEYLKGHIPNAINIWRSDIEDKTYPYKGMSADSATIEKLLQQLGIDENDIVIVYDDMGLCDATRLWWVLKTHNFNRTKLVNGGWQAWKETGGQISMEVPEITPSDFKLLEARNNELYIGMEDDSKLLSDEEGVVLLDTRTTEEYSGEFLKKGAKRSGRIPQSHHIDWMNAIDKTNMLKFKSVADLEKIYTPVVHSKDSPIIVYCHTGVRSAHTTFVLTELLGYTNVRNYDGSWSEWSYFEHLPIEKDSDTKVLN